MFVTKKLIRSIIREAVAKSSQEETKKSDVAKEPSQSESLKKIGVFKTKKDSVIGGVAYLKFIKGKSVYALDTDGVLYSRGKSSGKDYDPVSDLKELQKINNNIIEKFSKSGFVNKVKKAMISRSSQAKKQDAGRIKELLANNFRYIPSAGDIFMRATLDRGDSKGSNTFNKLNERWSTLRKDLVSFLKRKGIDCEKSPGFWNNASRRGINASYDTKGNKARIEGTNHGFGLAFDFKYWVPSILKGEAYSTKKNILFAKNKKFVKALYEFSKTQSDLVWGGTWGGSDPANGMVKGRGVLEIHHWELKPSQYSKYISKDMMEIIEILGFSASDINSAEGRSNIYRAIEEKFVELFGDKNSTPWKSV